MSLKSVMGYLIGDFLQAFVPGKSISECALITQELLHHVRNTRKGKKASLAFKADMNKI